MGRRDRYQARQEASAVVGAGREQAERIKRDSDRELAAATARRDSITAQLTNVRQMLATLGGGTFANPLADLEEAAPAGPVTATELADSDDEASAMDAATGHDVEGDESTEELTEALAEELEQVTSH